MRAKQIKCISVCINLKVFTIFTSFNNNFPYFRGCFFKEIIDFHRFFIDKFLNFLFIFNGCMLIKFCACEARRYVCKRHHRPYAILVSVELKIDVSFCL